MRYASKMEAMVRTAPGCNVLLEVSNNFVGVKALKTIL